MTMKINSRVYRIAIGIFIILISFFIGLKDREQFVQDNEITFSDYNPELSD